MKTVIKITLSSFAICVLAACSGSASDSFFQADGTGEGVVCIDGLYENTSGKEAKDIVDRLFKYYGNTTSTSKTFSAHGYGATCDDYKAKPSANLTITADFYQTVIIPKTQ
jgi:hypothetical protein